MPMWLFRRNLDISQAMTRISNKADIAPVTRLLRNGARRYYGFTSNELIALLTDSHAIVLESMGEIWGVAMVSNRQERATWIRCIALDKGLEVATGMQMLLSSLHQALHKRGLDVIFYAGDETADAWVIPALHQIGYIQDADVLVYETHAMDIPSHGNQHVSIRPARSSDMHTIRDIDHACFEAQWTKDNETLETAFTLPGMFIVAELSKRLVGFAHATSHFEGRLIHLVRIAVEPSQQGQAIGIRLLAEVVRFAREQKANIITLNTQSYNERAQKLYRWFGFTPTGERQPILRYNL